MALEKETITINFSQGLDTLDDPNQLAIGKFTSLVNSVFVKSSTGEVGALKKRNGFTPLPATVSTVSYLANYNETIVGIGQGSVQTFSPSAQAWTNQGYYQPLSLSIKSLIKNSYSQRQQDSNVAYNGIGCVAYNLGDPNHTYKYALFDSTTGQIVSPPTILATAASTTFAIGKPVVLTLGSSFYIAFGATSSNTSVLSNVLIGQVSIFPPYTYLGKALLPFNQNVYITSNVYTVSSTTNSSIGVMFDATIASSSIVLSYLSPTTGAGCNVIGANISPAFTISTATITVGSFTAAAISTCFDPATSTVYTTLGSGSTITYMGNNFSFAPTFAPTTKIVSSLSANYQGSNWGSGNPNWFGVSNIATIASGSFLQSFYEVATYYYQSRQVFALGQNFVSADNIINRPVTSLGVVGSETIIGPAMGLGSKPFYMNGSLYLFGAGQDILQPSYFLINSTGSVISKFAYGNGGGYYYYGIPSVAVNGNSVSVSYLRQDLLVAQNTGVVGSNSLLVITSPYYTQTGINQGTFTFSTSSITAKQTGNVLSINGGFLWTFDGLQTVENNFFLYPSAYVGSDGSPGDFGIPTLPTQSYQYQVTYESMDGQGNISRSTPAIGNTITFANITSACALIAISNPRLGYRAPTNLVQTSIYRWSQAQPIFYKIGSYVYSGAPVIGSLSATAIVLSGLSGAPSVPITVDSTFVLDGTQDGQITGNEILYTNGNVVEDMSAPSFISMDVWDERLWGISAEDGTLWFSKPLVEAEPVEMNGNDFTLYVPPNQTSQGTLQSPLCLAPLDANQILFCKSSILFITGVGPDATDANSQYSEPAQIPSQVGCSNPNSIVQTPMGIMFQSDNGIWLLGRDLSVKYVGKEVEAYNSIPVTSAVCVPGTNEVRFSLNNGTRLVYDMLADQWATFSGVVVQSGTIVNGIDTVVSTTGQIFQETQNAYLDNGLPVVMSFTTGWINSSGLQGWGRNYFLEILATYQSPHTYTVGVAYDYNPAIAETHSISPYNTLGSGSSVEQWQIWFKRPQCQSFQLTFNEISSGTAGAGLIISAMNLTYGRKKSYARNIPAQNRT